MDRIEQDGEDDQRGSGVAFASGLKDSGERPPGTPPSLKVVPLFLQAARASNRAAARVIFVILFILSIPLLPFPDPDRSRCPPGAMRLGAGG
jgi:hypothetical protein